MNIVLILVDSLNRRHLSCYGGQAVPTVNLDALASSSARFENAFVGSLPCMPARRDLFTGKQELLWRPWGPLEIHDQRLPRLLEGQGYTTGIVTDHYHYWEEHGNGYLQSFQSAELVRGHEIDYWQPPPRPHAEVPEWVRRNARWRPGWAEQYYANVEDFTSETDFFASKVFGAASDWLAKHGRRQSPFFLQVECFDVHEPFHVPEPYRSTFGQEDGDDHFTTWPPYQNADLAREFIATTTDAELEHIRQRYAAKVAMIDHWLGKFLNELEHQGLADDTVVIFTTDHGHDLGERGAFGKSDPHFDDHANIPLIVRHPLHGDSAPSTLTTAVDLFATILDVAGAPVPHGTEGRSLQPALVDPSAKVRDHVLFGTYGQGLCITDGTWTLLKAPENLGPLFSYSTMQFRSMMVQDVRQPIGQGSFIDGVPYPQWKVPVRDPGHACMEASPRSALAAGHDLLFNRVIDPEQQRDRWSDPDALPERQRLLRLMMSAMTELGSPEEQFARLGLRR